MCCKENMDNFPDQLIWEIFSRIDKTNDRNSISSACKRFYNIDNEQRRHLRVGCGLNPTNEALTSLCHRFPKINEIEITYSGWTSESGNQLEDPGLSILPNICPLLTNLTLSHCTLITDAGLSSLASCSNLSSLKLNVIPGVMGSGLHSTVSGCKNLKRLHLVGCANISDLDWLKCLGWQETVHDLCIRNCKGIKEGHLVLHSAIRQNIKRLHFEPNPNDSYRPLFEAMVATIWKNEEVACENLVELVLTNCLIKPGRGLACILNGCKNLEKIHLDTCIGARDCDIIGLAQNSKNLRAVSVRVPSDSSLPRYNPVRLTDDSLMSLALNCTRLESVSISFADGEFSLLPSFSLEGILSLVKMCPVKSLFLDGVYCFNNTGMEALCGSEHLKTLELIRCKEVTDEGFKPLIGSRKLGQLIVKDCPQVSLRGVQGAAKSVSYS